MWLGSFEKDSAGDWPSRVTDASAPGAVIPTRSTQPHRSGATPIPMLPATIAATQLSAGCAGLQPDLTPEQHSALGDDPPNGAAG